MAFKTHREGGTWLGGGTEVANCDAAEQTAVQVAFRYLAAAGEPCVAGISGLEALANCLSAKTLESLEIDCRGGGCNGIFGSAGGGWVNLCSPALPPSGNQADTDVTLFHEVIHTCGGGELDAWALENHCYAGHGTLSPGPDTVRGFVSQTSDVGGGLRASKFLVWNPSTGQVAVKVETGGGGWLASPTVSAGVAINVNTSAYVLQPGGGGSWL